MLLHELVNEYVNDWSLIASKLQTRTEHDCKIKYLFSHISFFQNYHLQINYNNTICNRYVELSKSSSKYKSIIYNTIHRNVF